MANKEHKKEAYLKINPNGKVPALVDGDITLFESCAINNYLAETYKKELLGKTAKERALATQWSYWILTELQDPIIDIYIQKFFVPDEHRNQKVIDENVAKLPGLFTILNNHLATNKYLAGNEFTVADVNVGSIVSLASNIGIDVKVYSNVLNWIMTITERPGFRKYAALAQAASGKK